MKRAYIKIIKLIFNYIKITMYEAKNSFGINNFYIFA